MYKKNPNSIVFLVPTLNLWTLKQTNKQKLLYMVPSIIHKDTLVKFYLDINLTKHHIVVVGELYKMLRQDIVKHLNKWKIHQAHGWK